MENETKQARPLEIFLALGSLVLTIIVAFATGSLLFSLIHKTVADPLALYTYRASSDAIRYAIATLVITFPLLLLSRHYLKYIADRRGWTLCSKIYDVATYIVLFAALGTIVCDLITVLFNFLQGEATLRFILKALVVLVIAILIFGYYFVDRRRREFQWREPRFVVLGIEGITTCLVLIGIVAGFVVTGGPGTARLERYDDERINDLEQIEQGINWYADTFGVLPETLLDFKQAAQARAPYLADTRLVDPATDQPYTYTPIEIKDSAIEYELCATFETVAQDVERFRGRWNDHTKGAQCETIVYDVQNTSGEFKPRMPAAF